MSPTAPTDQQIGETIEHCAVETERILRGNEERASLQQVQKYPRPSPRQCSTPQSTQLPASKSVYMNGNTHPHAQNHPHSQNIHSPQRHASSEAVLAPNRFVHQTHFPNGQHDHITPTPRYPLKRYPSISLPELEHRNRVPLQLVTAGRRDNIRPYGTPKGPRPNKRVRINWTDAENALFFDIIRKNATEDETNVLREIVTALRGSRSWVQCKGHFRNLLAVGKITQNKKGRLLWEVHEDVNNKPKETPKVPTSSEFEEQQGKSERTNGSHISSTAQPTPASKNDSNLSSTANVNIRKETERQENNHSTYANGSNPKTGRSASIDHLINNISQERDNRNAQMLDRTNEVATGEQDGKEALIRPGEHPLRSKNIPSIARSEGMHSEPRLDAGRDRETAIFMSKQAAAKEEFERSNPDAPCERDIRAV